jgi:Tol biopolymer transport system component
VIFDPAPIVPDDYTRDKPLWSPDGTRLSYLRRERSSTLGEEQVMVWSSQSHNEEPLTALSAKHQVAYDWVPRWQVAPGISRK